MRVRTLVEQMLAGRLADRELTSEDYDRLVDAVMRIHGAVRRLRTLPPGLDDADPLREAERAVIVAAFDDVAAITGLPVAQLGALADAPGRGEGAPVPGPTP